MAKGYDNPKKTATSSGSAIADLVLTVGAADGTVADAGGAFNQGTTNDNNREFGAKINAILAALRDANIIPG